MAQYMLLLREDPSGWSKLSPDQIQKTVEKYMEWRNRSFVVGGKRLDSKTGRVMQKNDGNINVTDGPFSESREVLGGYYTIEAKDFDHAVALSMDHPHADVGTIEIREVMSMPQGD